MISFRANKALWLLFLLISAAEYCMGQDTFPEEEWLTFENDSIPPGWQEDLAGGGQGVHQGRFLAGSSNSSAVLYRDAVLGNYVAYAGWIQFTGQVNHGSSGSEIGFSFYTDYGDTLIVSHKRTDIPGVSWLVYENRSQHLDSLEVVGFDSTLQYNFTVHDNLQFFLYDPDSEELLSYDSEVFYDSSIITSLSSVRFHVLQQGDSEVWIDDIGVMFGTISVADFEKPASISILRAYPNPFNGLARIEAQIPYAAHARINLYNMAGQAVCLIHAGQLEAGIHNFQLSSDGLCTGRYYCQIQYQESSECIPVTVVK